MSIEPASKEPIRLEIGATADPRTCGSCHFFERFGEWNGRPSGYCNIRLLSWVMEKAYDGEGIPPKRLRDTDSCDLHRPSGNAYIVSKMVQS